MGLGEGARPRGHRRPLRPCNTAAAGIVARHALDPAPAWGCLYARIDAARRGAGATSRGTALRATRGRRGRWGGAGRRGGAGAGLVREPETCCLMAPAFNLGRAKGRWSASRRLDTVATGPPTTRFSGPAPSAAERGVRRLRKGVSVKAGLWQTSHHDRIRGTTPLNQRRLACCTFCGRSSSVSWSD
jgi:hypothetical protein